MNAPPVDSRVSAVPSESLLMHQFNSDASYSESQRHCSATVSEYEDDANGTDEAAKAALLEVFAGDNTKETHWLTYPASSGLYPGRCVTY